MSTSYILEFCDDTSEDTLSTVDETERSESSLWDTSSSGGTILCTSPSRQTLKREVTFGSVGIREFNRLPGDHPEVQHGPPLTIGWEFVQKDEVLIDDYELSRKPKGVHLLLNVQERQSILLEEFEVPLEEIKAAEMEAERVKKLRKKTRKILKREKKMAPVAFVRS